MTGITAGQVLARTDGVVQREVAEEMFLVPIRGHLAELEELFVLNEAGRWLWDHLDGERTLAELAAGLAAEFEVDERTAARDAEAFARQLVDAGLAASASAAGV